MLALVLGFVARCSLLCANIVIGIIMFLPCAGRPGKDHAGQF